MAVNLIDSTDITITQTGEDITLNLETTNLNSIIDNRIITNNSYSTTEIIVGTYNGKPLYRTILPLDPLENNGETKVYYDSTYIIQKFDIYVENPTGGYKFHLPVPGTNYISAFIEENNHYIGVQTASDRTAFTNNYVIVEYTKTTD